MSVRTTKSLHQLMMTWTLQSKLMFAFQLSTTLSAEKIRCRISNPLMSTWTSRQRPSPSDSGSDSSMVFTAREPRRTRHSIGSPTHCTQSLWMHQREEHDSIWLHFKNRKLQFSIESNESDRAVSPTYLSTSPNYALVLVVFHRCCDTYLRRSHVHVLPRASRDAQPSLPDIASSLRRPSLVRRPNAVRSFCAFPSRFDVGRHTRTRDRPTNQQVRL